MKAAREKTYDGEFANLLQPATEQQRRMLTQRLPAYNGEVPPNATRQDLFDILADKQKLIKVTTHRALRDTFGCQETHIPRLAADAEILLRNMRQTNSVKKRPRTTRD